MIDRIQDSDLVKADLRNWERLKSERMPWESTWRAVDDRFPDAAGGFNQGSPGSVRGAQNYDTTHIIGAERFNAAMAAITTPEEKFYIKPRFAPELMKYREVQIWCQVAGERMYYIRHAAHTGFSTATYEDWDQTGRYGTAPLWTDARRGRGMFYRALHLSTCWIDVDYAGLVDTVFRLLTDGASARMSARQLEQMFGREELTPKMRDALDTPGKEHTEFEVLHVVTPNTAWDQDKLDWRRMPIASRYLAVDEKLYMRRAGYYTNPVSVSRHLTSPGEKYGRSPAIKMLPTIDGVNAMKHTTLRAGNKAVDPALLFNNDGGVTRLVTRPGGLNAGLVDDMGRAMVQRMPGGEQGLPYAMDMIEGERQSIRTAFMEEFYKILTDPNSRMTTTEVLEVMAKQGVLVRPYASRYATEKQVPTTNRELDLQLRAGQLPPFPPVVLEAGAWPVMDYENPLAAMARAESTGKSLRFVEYATQVAAIAETPAADAIDIDEMLRGGAEEIGVKPQYIRSPEAIEALRRKRDDDQAVQADAGVLADTAGAVLDLSKAGQIREAA